MHLKVKCPNISNQVQKDLCAIRQEPSKQSQRINSQTTFPEGTVSLAHRQLCKQ